MKHILKNPGSGYTALEQGQVDYAFKALKAEGRRRHTPTPQRYAQFLESVKADINASTMSPSAKQAALLKLDKALESTQIPDGSTFYALKHMVARGEQMRTELETRSIAHGSLIGRRPSTVRRQFSRMYDSLVSPRGDGDYTDVLDPRSRQAFDHLRNAVQMRWESTPRITRTPTGRRTIVSQGYDPEDGRLEVELHNGGVYAFHGVPQEAYDRFIESPTAVFNEIRTSHEHNYADKTEADADSRRLWCESCQRFRIASGHSCEANEGRTTGAVLHHDVDEIFGRVLTHNTGRLERGTIPTAPYWRRADSALVQSTLSDDDHVLTAGYQGSTPSHAKRIAPDMDKLIQKVKDGEFVTFKVGRRIYVRGSGRRQYNDVTTTMTARRVNGNRDIQIAYANRSQLECTCEVYQRNSRYCTHTHPSGGRANRFVTQDVSMAIIDITGEHGDQRVLSPDSGSPQEVSLNTEGDVIVGNYRALSGAQINGMLYDLSQNQRGFVRMVVAGDEGEGRVAPDISFQLQNGQPVFQNSRGTASTAHMAQIRAHIENQVTTAINGAEFTRDRLRTQAERSLGSGWEIVRESRQEYLSRFNPDINGYMRNPDQFLTDWRAAQTTSASGLPFVEESVTNGDLSNRQGRGRGFGIEIEIDGGARAMNSIIAELNNEGLSNYRSMARYHQPNDFRYWRMERDATVSGEIVSPILYDTPESWEQVRRVCEIAREHGGRASRNTGNHIHIGASNISLDQRRGVLAAVAANQDVIRRIATNPTRRTHRTTEGNSYSHPFTDRDIQNAYNNHSSYYGGHTLNQSRGRMANFTRDNTIEFRDPDGSLDPGHIQANVMLSAALMRAGEHGRWSDLNASTLHNQRIGANALRQPYVQNVIENEDERILAENISLMTTLDALFPERAQRQRILNVAALVPWQTGDNY